MWESLLKAVALLLIIEGIIPFLYPDKWRNLVVKMATIENRQLQLMGLVSMLLGVGLIFLL